MQHIYLLHMHTQKYTCQETWKMITTIVCNSKLLKISPGLSRGDINCAVYNGISCGSEKEWTRPHESIWINSTNKILIKESNLQLNICSTHACKNPRSIRTSLFLNESKREENWNEVSDKFFKDGGFFLRDQNGGGLEKGTTDGFRYVDNALTFGLGHESCSICCVII